MNFPSCIKPPPPRHYPTAETSNNSSNVVRDSITYDQLLTIANIVFGHGRWSHSVTSQTVDFVEYVMGKYHIGCAAFVRVQLADGTFHEDMGYSNTESAIKGSAIYAARDSSITLALKKALLCFGGVVEEKINDLTGTIDKNKRKTSTSQDEKTNGLPGKVRKVGQEISTKESKYSEKPITYVEEPNKLSSKSFQTISTPKRNKSPKPVEPDDDIAISDEVLMTEFQEPGKVATNDNAPHKDQPPAAAMTDEEIRLERKRKQKQKQEEYQKLMKDKLMKNEDKANPRF